MIEKAYKAFDKFISMYNLEDTMIKLKYEHTLRVAKLAKEIALAQNLSNEEVFIVELAALLHDIGRFEQAKKYQSFEDGKTFDHGAFGISVLFDSNLIRYFIDDARYDDLIKRVIYAHNKYSIPSNYNQREIMISKIIRDADKIDIFELVVNKPIVTDENPLVSQDIMDKLMAGHLINGELVNTRLDRNLLTLAFIYDINFKYSYFIIQKNNYVNRIIDRIIKIIDNKNYEVVEQLEILRNKISEELIKYE